MTHSYTTSGILMLLLSLTGLVVMLGIGVTPVDAHKKHDHHTPAATPKNTLDWEDVSCANGIDNCCSASTPIGFNFQFNCVNYTNYTTNNALYLSFDGGDCNILKWPSILLFAAPRPVRNRGTVEEFDYTINSVAIRVIEWNDVAFDGKDDHLGTFQVWLFANRTLALVYHLSKVDSKIGTHGLVALIGPNNSTRQLISNQDPTMLQRFDAYMLVPGATCSSPYVIRQWVDAPDICFREDALNLHGRIPHQPHSGFDYQRLSDCEDGNKFGSSKHHNGKHDNAADSGISKKKFSTASGIATFFILLGIAALAFSSSWVAYVPK
jgi:hypothetical protein